MTPQNYGTNFMQMMSAVGTLANQFLGINNNGSGMGGGQGMHHRHPHHPPQQGGQPQSGSQFPQLGTEQGNLQAEIQNMEQTLQGLMGGAPGASGFGMGGFGSGTGWQQQGFGGQGFGGQQGFGASQQQPWTVTNTGSGQDSIDLGDYTLSLNKSSEQWVLTNKQTGAQTNVWGDPHVNEGGSGSQTFGFKNNLTFQLADGTTITAKTIPYGNGQTVTSELDISKGGQGLVVTGLGGSLDGPLQTTSVNGYMLSAQNFGTNTIFESGQGWTDFQGNPVTGSQATQDGF